jgi:hypothetical protein
MTDALNDTYKLVARADAAIAEAKRLTQEIRRQRDVVHAYLKQMRYHMRFEPKTDRILGPQDFPNRRPAYQPFSDRV